MREIFLNEGYVALVDDKDFERVRKYVWSVQKIEDHIYAQSKKTDTKQTYMHRFIMRVHGKNVFVTHLDGNGLNNQRSNLQVCTRAEAMRNQQKIYSNNKSGYRGVCWNKARQKWLVQIAIKGRPHHIGMYTDIIEAAKAFDTAAIAHYGKYHGLLNFPPKK
jgi:hypothetical protein